MGHVATLYKCMCKTEVGISPHSLCGSPWVNVYKSDRRISRWRRKCSSVCALISVSFEENCAETYEMLQAAYGKSCLSRSKTFEWYSRIKTGRRSFEDDPPPRQAFHLPHRGDGGTCARNHSC